MSVIVPVHGNRGELDVTLAALSEQDYPGEVEVIVVDNGDNEGLPTGEDGVIVIAEATPGSYAARNAGVARARGAVLAFTDADCRPDVAWLSRAVAALLRQERPSFVGGQIEVELDPAARPTAAAMWDRLHSFPQDVFIDRDGFAATANLVVSRDVFDAVGPFDGALRSGGDRDWGERAVKAGIEPVYASDAVVFHSPRTSLAAAQRKLLRVRRGWAEAHASRGLRNDSVRSLIQLLRPRTRSVVRLSRRLRSEGYSRSDQFRYIVVAHWLQYFTAVAWLRAAFEVRALRRADRNGGPVVLGSVLDLEDNPYAHLWSAAVRRSGARLLPLTKSTVRGTGADRPRWVHIQWPERALADARASKAAFGLARLLTLVAIAKARGARVMVTAHNVWSHDGAHRALEALLWRLLGWLTTDLHLLSEASEGEFLAAHPTFSRATRRVIAHGNYAPVVGGAPDRDQAREALGIQPDAHVFLAFGRLRRYKGVEDLVRAFGAVENADARLIIGGRVTDDVLADQLESAKRADPRVILLSRFLDPAELARLVRAADCVVLPYRQVLNSGSALLALTLGRPVILPQTPSFESLRRRVGEEWVSLYRGRLDASHLAAAPRHNSNKLPDLEWCNWDRISDQLAALWAS